VKNPSSRTASPAAPRLQPDVGKRVGAAVIDLVILTVWIIAFSLVFGDTKAGSDESEGFSINLSGLPFLVCFLSCYVYYFALEAFWNGQTVGKKLLKLRVVSTNGQPLSTGQVLIRTLLRFVDGLPIFYLVGFVAINASKDKQRLGDMAAGTNVVSV
jgi:uncharacterized RDD family membrane protein YckC